MFDDIGFELIWCKKPNETLLEKFEYFVRTYFEIANFLGKDFSKKESSKWKDSK